MEKTLRYIYWLNGVKAYMLLPHLANFLHGYIHEIRDILTLGINAHNKTKQKFFSISKSFLILSTMKSESQDWSDKSIFSRIH